MTAGRVLAYQVVGAVLLVVYAVAAPLLWTSRDWVADGALSPTRPAATGALTPGLSINELTADCVRLGKFAKGRPVKTVAARVGDVPYYACYQLRERDGQAEKAAVVDAAGVRAPERVVKDGGAWPWIGAVTNPGALVFGWLVLGGVLLLHQRYAGRVRPGPPTRARWWQGRAGSAVLGAVQVLPLTLPFRRSESRARRLRLLYLWVFYDVALGVGGLFLSSLGDRVSGCALALIGCGLLWGWLGGWTLLRPAGFGAPDRPGTVGAPA